MQELKENKTITAGKSGKPFQYGIRIAIVLVILFGISVLYEYLTMTPEKLFSENFQAFELNEAGDTTASALKESYKKGNIEAVIREFDTLKSPEPLDYILAGNAFLGTHQPAKAIQVFLAFLENPEARKTRSFDEDAEYYLAFSYLGNREPGKALPLFEKIYADPYHRYNKNVSAWFLRKLKRSLSAQ
ncbi:MAG TPA: hypothetical protein DIC22_07245 [Chitinophagaceae bacterium]|jgi:hypothetical protein|nr:hypothetical protein [Chitinophagaceae bacterium]